MNEKQTFFETGSGAVWKWWALAGVLIAATVACPAAAGEATAVAPRTNDAAASFIDFPIRFFQDIISPVDGPRCNSHPTCSAYARQSLARHGPLVGWIMTCDRLMRDGRDDNRLLPRIRVGGHEYADDPVSANDFWWYRQP